jgi:hypothetical protein
VSSGSVQGHDRLAGRDADSNVERDARAPLVQLADPVQDRERRTYRTFGVIAARERRAEHRHHAVAHVLLDCPAEALDALADYLVVQLVALADVLGIGTVGRRGRPHHVDEQDRDELALLVGCDGGELVAARGAEPGAFGRGRAAP